VVFVIGKVEGNIDLVFDLFVEMKEKAGKQKYA